MIGFAPLIAGIETLIIPAIVIIIFLINAISHIAKQAEKGRAEQNRPPNPQRPPNPPQPRANVPRPPQAGQQAVGRPPGGVADEINSFLNRLTQQPAAQQQPQQRPVQQPTTARLVEAARPLDAEVVTLPDAESVGSHVRSHLGSRELEQRLPTRLEGAPSQADDKLEARLHGVFDHRVGSLARSEEGSESTRSTGRIPATAAVGLAAMFANPGNIRQAIIMQEILNRPTDRWS